MSLVAISRVGPHHITIKDPELVLELRQMNVKDTHEVVPHSFQALSDIWLDGYEIPSGTLISTL